MNVNLFALFFSVFFVIVLQTRVSSRKPSYYHPIKSLEDVKKDDKIQEIKNLKVHLKRYGYLSDDYLIGDNDNYIDAVTELAIKTYQLNFNLNVTGKVDVETLSMIKQPRCGVPDIINGTTRMNSAKHVHQLHFEVNNSHSHYSFFDGNPRWPPSRRNLTYGFSKGFRTDGIDIITEKIQLWNKAVDNIFTFTKIEDISEADIKISFERWDHGDNKPFDGSRGILAHSFAPQDGRLHFDGSEQWVVGKGDGFDIGTVGLHEFGHILGLLHSSDSNAIMWPTIGSNFVKSLGDDDIKGIKELYK